MPQPLIMKGVRLIHKLYKTCVSPCLGNACRFEPYCSDYAVDAIEKHGLIKGFIFAIKRVIRCHPFCKGGYDPVPDNFRTLRRL